MSQFVCTRGAYKLTGCIQTEITCYLSCDRYHHLSPVFYSSEKYLSDLLIAAFNPSDAPPLITPEPHPPLERWARPERRLLTGAYLRRQSCVGVHRVGTACGKASDKLSVFMVSVCRQPSLTGGCPDSQLPAAPSPEALLRRPHQPCMHGADRQVISR